ncbi:hypothetical protein [Streptomyces sp. NPDC088812]|uniref:hypothetical protein n=1 Tax=Streptomyces sp. NPDC088812 TaxID=3365905 RepID=UPI00381FADD7
MTTARPSQSHAQSHRHPATATARTTYRARTSRTARTAAARRAARAARPARVLAAAVATGTLLATAACAGGSDSATVSADAATTVAERPVAERPVAERQPTAPTLSPTRTPAASPSLTEAGAKTALITEADLEDDWNQVDDAASWRDSLLIGQVDTADFLTGKTQSADCQRLLDALYDDNLLGEPSGASALTGFEQGESRLLYQVAAYEKSDLDDSWDWMASLPDTCDQFTVTGGDSGERTVQVVEASLPDSGDARQGVTVTVKGTTGGDPVTLTLDVAAVRVGTDAITVTNGGLDGADHDSTKAAVGQGTSRLEDVLAGRSPKATPSGMN